MMAATEMEGQGVSAELAKDLAADQGSSPATLLLIVGEPFTIDQKDLILERIVTELFAWDAEAAKCDVDEQLGAFARQQPRGQDGPNGEKTFELKSEQLRVTVLLNARVQTVREKIHSFLQTPSSYRHLLYSGLALHGSGCWILQDGVFGFSSFAEIFHQSDVVQAIGAQPGSVLDVSTLAEGNEWAEANLKKLAPNMKIRLNPPRSHKNEDGVILFSDVLSLSLKAPSSVELLQSTDIVGNISFQRPTMYIFPAGCGDSALFGISGFNLLVNGGYSRRSCFWQFIRHLMRIDAVVLSHIGPDNTFGISSFFERKAVEKTPPELGAVYLNIGDTKPVAPNGALPVSTGLLVSLADEGAGIVDHLRHVDMAVQPCAGSLSGQTLQPINLYYKIGHGSLDMYVLHPLNGKELKDFLGNWAKNVNSMKNGQPVSDEHSVCSVLVWKPANPKEKTVRVLFPGNASQSKIFEGIERLKSVALFQTSKGVAQKSDVAAAAKTAEKKPSGAGKPPSGRAAASSATEVETKKPVPSAAEHKEIKKTTEPKEIKRTVEHKVESKGKAEPKEHRTPVKSETVKKAEGRAGVEHKDGKSTGKPEAETKKTEGKQEHKESKAVRKQESEAKVTEGKHGVEHREVKKATTADHRDPKRASMATAGEVKDAKAPASKADSTPNKTGAKLAEKAAKDAKNKKVAKETHEPKTPAKKTPVSKERAGAAASPTPTGKVDKARKEAPAEVKVEEQKAIVAPETASAVPPAVDVASTGVVPPELEKHAQDEAAVVTEKPSLDEVVPVPEKSALDEVPVEHEVKELESVSSTKETVKCLTDELVSTTEGELIPEKADLPAKEELVAEPVEREKPVLSPEGSSLLEDVAQAETVALSQSAAVDQAKVEDASPKENSLLDVAESEIVSVNQSPVDEAKVEVEAVTLDRSSVGEEKVQDAGLLAAEERLDSPVELERPPQLGESEGDHEPSGVLAGSDTALKSEEKSERDFVKELKPSGEESLSLDEIRLLEQLEEEEENARLSGGILGHDDSAVTTLEQLEIPEPVESPQGEDLAEVESHGSPKEKQLLEKPEKEEIPESNVESLTATEKDLDKEDLKEEHVAKNFVDDAGHVDSVKEPAETSEPVATTDAENVAAESLIELGQSGDLVGEVHGLLEEPVETPEAAEVADIKHKEVESLIESEPAVNTGKEDHWVPMEENNELSVLEEIPVDEAGDHNDSANAEGGNLSKTSERDISEGEAAFDPHATWGHPEGLPAPVNGKEGGSGKKPDHSVQHNASAASGAKKVPAKAAPSAVAKKVEAKDTAAKTKRVSTAPNDATREEKTADETTKVPAARTTASALAQKKPLTRSAEPHVKDSAAKVLDSKKSSAKPVVPFFVDLAYIPCHGDLRRFDADFFRVVRSQYYVLSSSWPNPLVLNLLLDAKESWENRSEEVTVIPTYETNQFNAWVSENQDRLKSLNVVVAPSASRCMMQLQEHEASCPAYRLEF